MIRPLALCVLLSLAGAGCDRAHGDDAGSENQPKVEEIAKNYKQLQAMTPEPVHVNPELAMLCRGASQADVDAAQKTKGPHANTTVLIYMNDPAANAFKKSPAVYPVGSIIVKEKKGQFHWDADQKHTICTADGVGGMIKHPPGFDASNGDWEYFYFTDPAKIESGKIASCVGCHAALAANKDHVFGNWATPESMDPRANH